MKKKVFPRSGKKWLNDIIAEVLSYCIEKSAFYLKGNVTLINLLIANMIDQSESISESH